MGILSVENISIKKISNGVLTITQDNVAVEEPLEIILEYSSSTGRMFKNIAVTMRTPGNDDELAPGFLFTEGIIKNNHQIAAIKKDATDDNRILVTLKESDLPVLGNDTRNFYSTSSCGICGKASIDTIRTISQFEGVEDNIIVKPTVFYQLQNDLKSKKFLKTRVASMPVHYLQLMAILLCYGKI